MPDSRDDHDAPGEPFELELPEPLIERLRRSGELPGGVPRRVDDRILAEAREVLARRRLDRVRRRLRRRAGALWGAVAAMLLLGLGLFGFWIAESSRRAAPYDLDWSGRVDILDAFLLARRVEDPEGRVDSSWDLNGDGRVDRGDVDLIAHAAVRLEPREDGR